MNYKFLIDENEIFAVDVKGLIISKMKTFGTQFWRELWRLQDFIDKNPNEYKGRFQISSDEYNKIFS